ncbi:hypothetical protein MPLSOD_130161 [Mesorhizobium sp. SOD10]|nr:hypothetical protein MPLSOD_130161 [Mesorhizobium sp. SOD10]
MAGLPGTCVNSIGIAISSITLGAPLRARIDSSRRRATARRPVAGLQLQLLNSNFWTAGPLAPDPSGDDPENDGSREYEGKRKDEVGERAAIGGPPALVGGKPLTFALGVLNVGHGRSSVAAINL